MHRLPDMLLKAIEDASAPVALARVVGMTGSAPGELGTAMVVTTTGEVVGSLSGGCVEAAVVATAEQVLADGNAVTERYGVTDDDVAIGLTCGGEIEVFVERVDAGHLDHLRALAGAIAAGTPVSWATILTPEPEWHIAIDGSDHSWRGLDRDVADLRTVGSSGIIGTDECEELSTESHRPRTFVQTFAPPMRLILCGANDVVHALCPVARQIGYRVTVVDARPVFATAARFPDADEVVVDWPQRYLATEIDLGRVDQRSAVIVMTHDAKFDVPTLAVALQHAGLAFIGALGSRRTHADRAQRLIDSGVTQAQIDTLRSPVGLDLGGHTADETAIAIAAELVSVRHCASGHPLSRTTGPIHRGGS